MDNARIYIKNLSVQTREDGSLYSDIFFSISHKGSYKYYVIRDRVGG